MVAGERQVAERLRVGRLLSERRADFRAHFQLIRVDSFEFEEPINDDRRWIVGGTGPAGDSPLAAQTNVSAGFCSLIRLLSFISFIASRR